MAYSSRSRRRMASTPRSSSEARPGGTSAAGRPRAATANAISSGGSTWSTLPVRIALRGIPLNWAESGLSQSTAPPALLISCTPREPSLPLPDRMTATARSPTSCARDRKNRSIGSVRPCRGSRSFSRRRRCRIIISFIGGRRYTVFGSSAMSWPAWRIGICVRRDNSSSMRLLKSGDRCCRTTNAIPVSVGRWVNSRSSESRPPADAPIPTM